MILDTIFNLTIGVFLAGIYGIFSSFSWHLPDAIVNGIVLYVQTVHTLNAILPFLGDIFSIVSLLVVVMVILYIVHIVQWIWAHVPFIGHHQKIGTKH